MTPATVVEQAFSHKVDLVLKVSSLNATAA